MLPSVIWNDFFDDVFGLPFQGLSRDIDRKLYGARAGRLMKTDVKDLDGEYEMDVELPGFNKEQIALSLDRGMLTISAAKESENEKKDSAGNIVHQEHYAGAMSRSFYIGENVKEEDIKARYENGVLSIRYPKQDEDSKKLPEHKQIAIE